MEYVESYHKPLRFISSILPGGITPPSLEETTGSDLICCGLQTTQTGHLISLTDGDGEKAKYKKPRKTKTTITEKSFLSNIAV